jgi:DNA-binding MarR family transcriptional regulator
MVNTMNKKTSQNDSRVPPASAHQLHRFHELIEDVRGCCEDKQVIEAEEFGVPSAEIRCLLLFGSERYLTVKGIAERMEVAKSRVTKIVNSMNKKGLIKITPDPADGRVKLLRLTREGRELEERVHVFQERMQAVILGKLDPADRRRVISGLELLRSAMHEAKAEMKAEKTGKISGAIQTDEVEHA